LRIGGPDGDYSAYTKWDLRWSIRHTQDATGCSLTAASIEVYAVVTLPALRDAAALDASALQRWQRYVQALREHELAHVENEVAGAEALRVALLDLESYGDCLQLGATVNALGEQQKQLILRADSRLDAETEHGALTGATFR
jgi:predicted secreted Zn-dependent protease